MLRMWKACGRSQPLPHAFHISLPVFTSAAGRTVLLDQPLQGLHPHLDGSGEVMALLLVQPCRLPLLVPNDMEARAASDPQSAGAAEERGRFHFGGQDPQTFPCLPLVLEFIAHRHPPRVMLSVKRVLALDDTCVPRLSQRLCRSHKRLLYMVIRHRRKFDGSIFPAGPLMADRLRWAITTSSLWTCNAIPPQVPTRIKVSAPMAASSSMAMTAEGPADPGGADRNLFPKQRPCIGGVFPIGLHLHGIVKVGGNLLAPGPDRRGGCSTALHRPLYI